MSIIGRIEQDGAGRVCSSETDITTTEPNAELLVAVHGDVEVDVIGSIQPDGAMWVTVTVQWRAAEAAWTEADDGPQAWTTVVPPDSSAAFAVAIEGAGDRRAEAHGTIRNRIIPM